MNCYDFDKTIYKKDSAISLLFFSIKRKPSLFFYLFYVLFLVVLNKLKVFDTKAFKEKYYRFLNKFDDKQKLISEFWVKEEKNISDWYKQQINQGGTRDVICSASPQFVVEPIMKKINPDCLVFCTKMDLQTFKIEGQNLKGEAKRKELEQFGITKFEKAYTDSLSDFPLYDMAQEKFFISKGKVFKFGEQKLGIIEKLKYLLKQMRIKHYVKNCLIFLPLIFSGLLTKGQHLNYLVSAVWGFVAFCLVASFVYIVNDLFDAKKDRNHFKKRKRPIAAYMVKPWEAIALLCLIAISVALIWVFCLSCNIWAIVILLTYIVVNLLYSFSLKKIPIVDVFVLAFCYVIRVYFGALIIGVGVSKWLYLTIICASLYMGYGKRRSEVKDENGINTRDVVGKYSFSFLDKNIYLCLTMCLVFYSLWAVDYKAVAVSYFNAILIMATIPLVIFILMKYSLDIEKNNSSGDPIDVFFKDYVLLFSALIYIVTIVVAIYVPISINV